MHWFDVDKTGLSKLLQRKGSAHIVLELLSNAWDEDVSTVDIALSRIHGTRLAQLTVTDDSPEGFVDLSHAYRLFAPSRKGGEILKRGRFNFGEKLVLAVAESAVITSTKGTVIFDHDGRRLSRKKTERGTVFTCKLPLTNAQIEECNDVMSRVIPPAGVRTVYNGMPLLERTPIATIEASLQTETADAEGFLRRPTRSTTISIYEPPAGRNAFLFELGIPVVETPGDRYDVSIGMKVPLDLERTSPTAAYLSKVRALVVEATHELLTSDDAVSPWVRDALHTNADSMSVEAIRELTILRFGSKAVAFDPSDMESNSLAVAQGYS